MTFSHLLSSICILSVMAMSYPAIAQTSAGGSVSGSGTGPVNNNSVVNNNGLKPEATANTGQKKHHRHKNSTGSNNNSSGNSAY